MTILVDKNLHLLYSVVGLGNLQHNCHKTQVSYLMCSKISLYCDFSTSKNYYLFFINQNGENYLLHILLHRIYNNITKLPSIEKVTAPITN